MLRTTIDTLRNFWAMENTRGFRRQMYMKRTILEDMSERFVDACEIIIGCDDYVIRNTLMNTLLDFASKYADGMVPKNTVEGTAQFAMQMVEDIA